MKLVKFIKHYSQTKPLSPKQLKRWKEEEQKIIRNILDSMDSDLDYINDYVHNKNDLDWKVEILDKRLSDLEKERK